MSESSWVPVPLIRSLTSHAIGCAFVLIVLWLVKLLAVNVLEDGWMKSVFIVADDFVMATTVLWLLLQFLHELWHSLTNWRKPSGFGLV